MRTTLECGCSVDDAVKSTIHETGSNRSIGDQDRKVHHYWLVTGGSPKGFCMSCDRYRPCSCDSTTRETKTK